MHVNGTGFLGVSALVSSGAAAPEQPTGHKRALGSAEAKHGRDPRPCLSSRSTERGSDSFEEGDSEQEGGGESEAGSEESSSQVSRASRRHLDAFREGDFLGESDGLGALVEEAEVSLSLRVRLVGLQFNLLDDRSVCSQS